MAALAPGEIQPAPRVVFRPFTAPTPAIQTYLAVRPDPPSRQLAALLDACTQLEPAEHRDTR
ncbi:hypothetical protein [Goodfellowiella coeruleoviolacea]|uniref:hypothetical protein n=1 Tax=Goodfellowiella coeruleoviolacea TaxID=334858 RepID=UPI0020A45A42|nr:hypothetical protein [Goodfellowiella coeruleoviolacea]